MIRQVGPFAVAALVFALGFAEARSAEEAGWAALFDGKTLDGWVQKNGTATYRVENGTIVGKTAEGSPNSFLCTKKDYFQNGRWNKFRVVAKGPRSRPGSTARRSKT